MENRDSTQWVRACAAADVQPGQPKGVKLAGIPIALYRLDDGVHATHDVCTHAYALLSEGYIEGDAVECPLHGALFDIRSGKCLAVATADLATYAVREDGGVLMVEVPCADAEPQ
ncbi:non-heme iron oxygenase ferredoxin subunit [Variovorax sp. RA8]|uniref:non-heme iron oxygenase ferredoxin subunit n=1 Tax=Variovorax sp. (strain JCM 16519 / RA8) TaxID=662548 RepID=UPI00131806CD|nr:non-heme iron oxygenase ferredoxin subunit [Variovorax sp. RA8]VTU30341.1 Naphthalene 1,2-dioxygenase system ferredoxin subunit [Variovorax sp. RA8]